jgi:hypothetical protein
MNGDLRMFTASAAAAKSVKVKILIERPGPRVIELGAGERLLWS